jgi:homoserine O-succinyltransferase
MPISLDPREWDANCIHIGLINNMPGSALEATERQFGTLLDAAAEDIVVRLSLYALPEIPRADTGILRVNHCYSNINGLWNLHLDGLIVTGTEPLAPSLRDEPYWGSLTTLLEWAEHNTYSAIWSCLAAHAALLQIDGIERRPLDDKRFGIFQCATVSDNPLTARLTAGFPDRLQAPHSRWHDIPENALKGCGYHVLTRSDDAGVDAFVKERNSLFCFFQGHPEYEADSLLLEYRRDIGRFLRREQDRYPSMPQGCFDEDSVRVLTAMRERAMSDRREELLAEFPVAGLIAKSRNTWRPAAVRFYRNWLQYLCARKAEQQVAQKRRRLVRSPSQPKYERTGDVTWGRF